ncbi:hypothetical protein KJ359_004677 [Pestalotiopsis sp. 9143b]|nr:hypothetical protein KJ359_004677 [Pestalotiopsis sp. 9143b]
MVSEDMVEDANATSIAAPYGIFEWDLSGLTQAPTTTVTPARVQESVFSIEGKVANINDFREYAKDGKSIAALVMIKAPWVREDATNADCSHIDLNKLRLIAQLGRMAYGRILSTFDRPRPGWDNEVRHHEVLRELRDNKT